MRFHSSKPFADAPRSRRCAGRCAAIVLAVVVSLGAAGATTATAHKTSGYSFDVDIGTSNPNWMASLSDDALLSDLSLPGTHDSGASWWTTFYDILTLDNVMTQKARLKEQLHAGIRALDIRLSKEDDGSLAVYHGGFWQHLDFAEDVVRAVESFLAARPTEAVVMRIKRETGAEDGFAEAVSAALGKSTRVYTGTDDNPPLRDIRGKIVVLQDFKSSDRIGIPWSDFSIQDDWRLRHNWALADKWRAVRRQLHRAQDGPRRTKYINFLSANGGSFPYFVASGHSSRGTGAPRLLTGWTRGIIDTCSGRSGCLREFPSVNCFLKTCSVAFEGINILTMNAMEGQDTPQRYGIVYADFPGKGLIKAIIASNRYLGVIRGTASGRCMDVPARSTTNGVAVQLYDCHGEDNQLWTPTAAGELKVYGVKCLDVRSSGTANGTPVQIYDCNGSDAQKWSWWPNGYVVNPQSGKCLDARADGRSDGTPLQIFRCHRTSNQRWERDTW